MIAATNGWDALMAVVYMVALVLIILGWPGSRDDGDED